MIKNFVTKEVPDVRGIVFRLIVVIMLLLAISIIIEGGSDKQAEIGKHDMQHPIELNLQVFEGV